MKYLLALMITAATVFATPITEKYMLVLIQKDVPIAERRFYIDNINARFNTCVTNAQTGVVTTNYFIKFVDVDNNARAAFTQEPDVTKHQVISNTVTHMAMNPYLWYAPQVSESLSKEVLAYTEATIGTNKIHVAYPNEDFSAWMNANAWVAVASTNKPF